ncbi:MAG TPA: hypothetical protein VJA21_23160 [Verrucomicrobiae bacterium]
MRTLVLATLVLLSWLHPRPASATGPFLRVASTGTGTNLLRNGAFEAYSGSGFSYWSAAPNGYLVATNGGRQSSAALACDAPDTTGWRGASQALTLNRTVAAPLILRGWSRAEAVSGGTDTDYSLYVDIIYQDGTPLWGQTANFATGTHDWQLKQVTIYPEKPVKSLTLYCLFRNHSGRVWFDDVWLEEILAGDGAFLFQGVSMTLAPQTNPPPPIDTVRQTEDGLRLGFAGSRLLSVQLDGRELATNTPGGFLARDVGTQSDVYGFANGLCEELGLSLEAVISTRSNCLAVEGRITNTRGGDRAVTLFFALPVEAAGWAWGDDIRRSRTIGGSSEYAATSGVDCGATGTMSLYPLASIHDAQSGLALGLDMGCPAVYRLVYHAATRQFFIAYDFGLAPDTAEFPGSAKFSFVIYRVDPRWGFRAALDKFQALFLASFEVRSPRQGIWMPFTDVSTVGGWEDFGFRYHEGDNNVGWDDQHGVLSFRYTEPMTWWMPMSPELPRTEEEALRVRDVYAGGSPGPLRDMALISREAAMLDETGQPALLFRNEPWANGAVWSLDPNPRLPAAPNAATVYWNDAARARYAAGAATKLDGEYLDSIEGYVTANLNFDRRHFAYTTVPLTFTTDTHRLALFKGLAVQEFTRWISEDVHRLGGLMFANGLPYRFGFLCAWLDVIGTETDWIPSGNYTPVPDSQLCLWRSLAGRKPYLLLMNTDYDLLTTNLVERYFLRSLAYGMFPSMFSHNAAENPYWQNPAWYNRDRPLFKKYIPLIREVAEAGWQPLTAATFDAAGVPLERFGPGTNSILYFTLLNDASQPRAGLLRVENDRAATSGLATERVSGRRLERVGDGWEVTVPPQSTAVVKLGPGPRFIKSEIPAAGRLRVTVASPLELQQVLELSDDLHAWIPLATNAPSASPYTFETALQPGVTRQFLRIRW